jgi:hypothetical protein
LLFKAEGFDPKALILPLRETSSEAEGFRALDGAEKRLRRPGARDQDDPERRANPSAPKEARRIFPAGLFAIRR